MKQTRRDIEEARQRMIAESKKAERRERLVDEILETFQNPSKWPLSDAEKNDFLRWLYNYAKLCK